MKQGISTVVIVVIIVVLAVSLLYFLYGTSYGACLRFCTSPMSKDVLSDPTLFECAKSPRWYTDMLSTGEFCLKLKQSSGEVNQTISEKINETMPAKS